VKGVLQFRLWKGLVFDGFWFSCLDWFGVIVPTELWLGMDEERGRCDDSVLLCVNATAHCGDFDVNAIILKAYSLCDGDLMTLSSVLLWGFYNMTACLSVERDEENNFCHPKDG